MKTLDLLKDVEAYVERQPGVWDGLSLLKAVRSKIEELAAQRAAPQVEAAPAEFTTGHCAEKARRGGCQLPNVQCGYPQCDRKPRTTPQPAQAAPIDPTLKFISAYCDRSGISCEYFLQTFNVVKCACGEPECEGFATTYKKVFSVKECAETPGSLFDNTSYKGHDAAEHIGVNDKDGVNVWHPKSIVEMVGIRYRHAQAAPVMDAQRVGLTEAQIEALGIWERYFIGLEPETCQEITRAIEAAHGIQPTGEKGGAAC